jgi:ATP-dependent Clp protease ATP-binding subunit ClpC
VFDKFDATARRAVVEAQEVARRDRSHVITIQHLLAGILHTIDAPHMDEQRLESLGLPVDDLLATVEQWFPEHEPSTSTGHIPFDRGAIQGLSAGMGAFAATGSDALGTEHLALGVLVAAEGERTFLRELGAHGLTVERIRSLL